MPERGSRSKEKPLSNTSITASAVNRIHAMAELPGAKSTRPSTILDRGFTGLERTFIVQSVKTPEGFGIFLQVADADGTTQLILPDGVAQAIYRQRTALTDRSTPASRARKRATADRKKRREAKVRRAAARNGG